MHRRRKILPNICNRVNVGLRRRAKASAPASGVITRSAAADSGSNTPASSSAQTQEAADAAYVETMRKLQVAHLSCHENVKKLNAHDVGRIYETLYWGLSHASTHE